MRYLLIVNPVSGGGRALPLLRKAVKYFRKKGDEAEVYRTSGPGDATRRVLDAGLGSTR